MRNTFLVSKIVRVVPGMFTTPPERTHGNSVRAQPRKNDNGEGGYMPEGASAKLSWSK